GLRVKFIGDMDFSELQLDIEDDEVSLAYFDDHVDSAARILQASEKGLKYLVFDDSTGLEGVCQRAYPAVPTIPMILDIECFRPGDRMAWTV
ncbi:hypothetical protein, partial [Klebsiella pneumoniae]|uniref:hypothetical protein n=1 Tax=Klebsiella pneumoniae TaxID=573 RepID=UPI002731C9E4